MLWTFVFAFVVYCPHFFYSMVYIISLQSKFSPGPKKNTRTERKLPRSLPDPFPWARTRTDPRFKQNMAPWPESGRGCPVRSGNPRRSGVPRSSLFETYTLTWYCTVSCIAPRWTGMCGALATRPPSLPNIVQEICPYLILYSFLHCTQVNWNVWSISY